MQEELFRALESGATAITAGRRLARVLTLAFDERQREQGRSVWKTPDILPLDAFLSRAWRDYLLRGPARAAESPTLLGALPEQILWEQVIRESPAGDSLLQISATARQAMEAWRLVQAYRLPVDDRFEASDDWAAFAAWSRAFRKRCDAGNWLEAARLPDVIAELIRTGGVPRLPHLYLAGFDELTSQQSGVLDALGQGIVVKALPCRPVPERWKLRDSAGEIRAAALWARRVLAQHPEAHIGVIVPNLAGMRSQVERIFRETLHPGATLDDHERAFHISLGPALHEYPVVHAALLFLELAAGRLPLPQAGMLLRSPFLGGASTEWTKRALLDARLRKHGVWNVTVSGLLESGGSCPALQRALQKFRKRVERLPEQQRAGEWGRDFSGLLVALGWPGDRTLSSREYQAVAAWQDLLSSLASLDIAATPMSLMQALERLREIAAASPFQVENQGAPIQIMGIFEASGLQFDHLWVMGLHDGALPAAANPNPFLPLSLQREYGLPHCSAERELEFAGQLMARLIASAPVVTLSYPESEEDRELAPSPVAGGPWQIANETASPSEWIAGIQAQARFEEIHDETAPPLQDASTQQGGTSIFKDMAACPFRAFAKHRMAARPLEETDLGVSRRDQGTAVHKALEFIWRELGSHSRLVELPPEQLRDLVQRGVEVGIRYLGAGIGHKLEQHRLEALLAEWLEMEKLRAPFTVLAPEEDVQVVVGGVQVQTRADRIDQLAGGRTIIVDYKTGVVKAGGWEGDRPDEPQLPLYCATSRRLIAGAIFALIRRGELGFLGATEPAAALPKMRKMRVAQYHSFDEQIRDWRRVLERLAENFRAGRAEVDPKPGACENCGLRALCRIREFENGRG